jgi:cell division protein FtsB
MLMMAQELKKKRPTQFYLVKFALIFVATVFAFLAVTLGRRVLANYHLSFEAERLGNQVAALRARHQALEKQLQDVQTDAYVEEVARTQLKWARPGETVVVVMPIPKAVPAPTPAPPVPSGDQTAPVSPWLSWWTALFGTPPPDLSHILDDVTLW